VRNVFTVLDALSKQQDTHMYVRRLQSANTRQLVILYERGQATVTAASLSVDQLCGTIYSLQTSRRTRSRTNWKHFCLTLTRISAFPAPANLGYTSGIIKHKYKYNSYFYCAPTVWPMAHYRSQPTRVFLLLLLLLRQRKYNSSLTRSKKAVRNRFINC